MESEADGMNLVECPCCNVYFTKEELVLKQCFNNEYEQLINLSDFLARKAKGGIIITAIFFCILDKYAPITFGVIVVFALIIIGLMLLQNHFENLPKKEFEKYKKRHQKSGSITT